MWHSARRARGAAAVNALFNAPITPKEEALLDEHNTE